LKNDIVIVTDTCLDTPVPREIIGYPGVEDYCMGGMNLSLTGVKTKDGSRVFRPAGAPGWILFLKVDHRPGAPQKTWLELSRTSFRGGGSHTRDDLSIDARAMFDRMLKRMNYKPEREIKGGSLGVHVIALTPELKIVFNLPSDSKGAFVAKIGPGSAAEKAGFKKGDLIVEFNGRRISKFNQLLPLTSALAPGTTVKVKVLREGRMKNITAMLGKLPEAVHYYRLGMDYYNRKNYTEAIRWFKKSAEHETSAQNRLGLMSLNGLGVPRDNIEAAKWFRIASDNGNRFAHFNMGRLYENGWGVPKNEDTAEKYYRKFGDYVKQYQKGARQGNKEAQEWLKRRGLSWGKERQESTISTEKKEQAND
jgi:hypothetical protein